MALVSGSLACSSRTTATVTTPGWWLLAAGPAFKTTVRTGNKAAVKPARIAALNTRNANFDLLGMVFLSKKGKFYLSKKVPDRFQTLV
jgi:hypothetical protein